MNRMLSILLAIGCLLCGGWFAPPEESQKASGFDQSAFDAFVKDFGPFGKEYPVEKNDGTPDEETSMQESAYLAYAKRCAQLISDAADDSYQAIISIYEYSPTEVAKAFVITDDLYTLLPKRIERNKEGSSYEKLISARKAYRDLQSKLAQLSAVMEDAVEAPEKYAHIDAYIDTSFEKLDEMNTILTDFCNDTGPQRVRIVLDDVEKLFLDESILALRAIFYVDSMTN